MTEVAVSSSEFRELIAEMAAGSEDAAWKVADLYTPHILRAIRKTLPQAIRQKADSQDYAQAVWASILIGERDLSQFQEPQQLLAYLVATARNKVIDNYRRYTRTQARDINVEVSADALGYSEDGESSGRSQGACSIRSRDLPASQVIRVREQWDLVLSKCSERDRTIIELRRSGVGLKEIADRIGVNEKTVRRTLNRVLDGMRS